MSAPDADRLARVALGRLAEPGDPRLASLVAELGAEEVHDRLAHERDDTGIATEVASRLRGLDPAADLERAARQGIRFVCPADDEWPARMGDLDHAPGLNQRGGAPLGLWVRGSGRLDELALRSVSVVGSRSATTYGAAVAGEVAAHVAAEGVTVVSGAAYGIDQAGHRGALSAARPTVAVLACGADRAYPAGHRDLLAYIAESGGLVDLGGAAGVRPDEASVPVPQPAHRGHLDRHGRRRGCGAQRRAQHRELGGPAEPRRDGRPRAGDQRAVRRGPRADPHPGCCVGDARQRRAGAGLTRRRLRASRLGGPPSDHGTG